jgi:hypothetical protein
MKGFTHTTKMVTRTKIVATTAFTLAALTGATLTPGATAREVAPADASLVARVVQLGHVPGFWAADCPLTLDRATAWAQGDRAESTAVRSEGFAVGVREVLRSGSGDIGASVALRFGSAAGARADLDRREQRAGRSGYAMSFPIPGSLSVRGYSVRSAGVTTVHVAFTRGNDEYAIVVQAAKGTSISALEQTLATVVGTVAGRS